jgi:hypothetical protein
MRKGLAVEQLLRTARVVYRGVEIWETQNAKGYTGHYRVAPAGKREHFAEAKNITQAFKIANTLIHHKERATK